MMHADCVCLALLRCGPYRKGKLRKPLARSHALLRRGSRQAKRARPRPGNARGRLPAAPPATDAGLGPGAGDATTKVMAPEASFTTSPAVGAGSQLRFLAWADSGQAVAGRGPGLRAGSC